MADGGNNPFQQTESSRSGGLLKFFPESAHSLLSLGKDEAPILSNMQVLCVQKDLVFYILLSTLQFMLPLISISYMLNSYFGPGDVDCRVYGQSEACKSGSIAKIGFYAISGIFSGGLGWILTMYVGSWSDSVGRVPLLQANAIIGCFPAGFLMLHQFNGLDLMFYVISAEVMIVVDVLPVITAVLVDVVDQPRDRARGFAIQGAVMLMFQAVVVFVSGQITPQVTIICSAVVSLVRILFLFTSFPETRVEGDNANEAMGLARLLRDLGALIRNRRYLIRMTFCLLFQGVATAGLLTVLEPYLQGWIGLGPDEMGLVQLILMVSMVLWLVAFLGPLVYCMGEVRSLRLTLVICAAIPFIILLAETATQVYLIVGIFGGAISFQFSLSSALVSNLGQEEDQGLVQGLIGAVAILSNVGAKVIFAPILAAATDGGTVTDKAGLQSIMAAISAINVAGLIVCCLLPPKVVMLPAAKQSMAEIVHELTGH